MKYAQKTQESRKIFAVSLTDSEKEKLSILAERADLSRSAYLSYLIELEYRRLEIVMQSTVEQ